MFGFGLGAVLLVVVVSLFVSHKNNSYSLYQTLWGIVLGLLLASIVPGLPNTMNQTVHSITTDLSHIHYSD